MLICEALWPISWCAPKSHKYFVTADAYSICFISYTYTTVFTQVIDHQSREVTNAQCTIAILMSRPGISICSIIVIMFCGCYAGGHTREARDRVRQVGRAHGQVEDEHSTAQPRPFCAFCFCFCFCYGSNSGILTHIALARIEQLIYSEVAFVNVEAEPFLEVEARTTASKAYARIAAALDLLRHYLLQIKPSDMVIPSCIYHKVVPFYFFWTKLVVLYYKNN